MTLQQGKIYSKSVFHMKTTVVGDIRERSKLIIFQSWILWIQGQIARKSVLFQCGNRSYEMSGSKI